LDMIGKLKENRLDSREAETHMVGRSFAEAKKMLAGEERLLIGVKKGENLIINPPLTYLIEADDKFISIK
jgi:voltage-gated potassium channel